MGRAARKSVCAETTQLVATSMGSAIAPRFLASPEVTAIHVSLLSLAIYRLLPHLNNSGSVSCLKSHQCTGAKKGVGFNTLIGMHGPPRQVAFDSWIVNHCLPGMWVKETAKSCFWTMAPGKKEEIWFGACAFRVKCVLRTCEYAFLVSALPISTTIYNQSDSSLLKLSLSVSWVLMLVCCLVTACASNRYGPDCSRPCQCQNGATCDSQTGACTCAPGYRGTACDQGKLEGVASLSPPSFTTTCTPCW